MYRPTPPPPLRVRDPPSLTRKGPPSLTRKGPPSLTIHPALVYSMENPSVFQEIDPDPPPSLTRKGPPLPYA